MISNKQKLVLYCLPLIVALSLFFMFDNIFDGTDPFTLINGLIGGMTAIYTQFICSKWYVKLDKEANSNGEKILVTIPYLFISGCVAVFAYAIILVIFNIIYPADPGHSASVTLFGAFIVGLAGISLSVVDYLDREDND